MTDDEIKKELLDGIFCVGCGAQIQTNAKNELGYTPMSALKKGLETDEVYCQRCFRLRHYNEIQPVSLTDDDFRRLLGQIADTKALIVYVVDIFDFTGSLIPGLHRFVGDNPVLLVGNKADVMPKSLKRTKLTNWMRQQANINGIRPIDVTLVSAKKGHSVADLMSKIDNYRQNRDVYVVGVTNVGKSTLINAIINSQTGIHNLITTSRFPGTTLDKIEIPFNDGAKLIDTPGIIHQDQMAHYLGAKELKYVSPQKEVKPIVYQLNEQQTLFMGGLARFDFIQGDKSSFVLYFENNLMLHRTKLEKADTFYLKHAGTLLVPPTSEAMEQFPELQRHEFRTREKSDVVINGLGWITVPANVTIAGWAPKGVSVIIRTAMI
ncbi:ribosome biogenesis GTPase YqeH [Weissella beninensis]|uniref:Ribosome biogenesis GTPase YqeH n=1 Tax=Periweissella beninensis TaxID=504936 RepID=A0ABT0VLX6_9LACO|nr:ribosome biogenesis GTPase YqeH [Periweissella beninensis]MBM7544020.1 ribosome biogenesis GTPase YqeH [Periweissella beninensis]MCM2437422.1 ribosome biogenesis GTPase YqeH [Periweissella beninensis]